MAWSTPNTVATSDVITAANHNTYIRDNLNYLKSAVDDPVRWEVYNSGAIAITTATITALTFDSESLDSAAVHSTSSNTGRATIPSGQGGYYLIGARIEFASNSTGYREGRLRLNGSTYVGLLDVAAVNGDNTRITPVALAGLNATEYAEVLVYQNSGGNLNVNASSAHSPYFWGFKVA